MAVPTVITDLSTTIASNSPASSEARTTADDYLRALSGFVAQLYNGTTAGQIVFPGTQNASSNGNTLDDYEEGTWTPTDISGAGLTLTSASGRYIKVGKCVWVKGVVVYPVTANGSNAVIGGLPFASANDSLQSSLAVGYSSVTAMRGLLVNANVTTASVYLTTGQATNAQLSEATIYFAGSYEAAA